MALSIRQHIARHGREQLRSYIAGEWLAGSSEARIEQRHPATNEVVTQFAPCTRDDVARAIAAARSAFDEGPWPKLRARDRKAKLQRIVELVSSHIEELSHLQTCDNGIPLHYSLNTRVSARSTADIFDHYAGWIDKINGEVYPQYLAEPDLQYLTFREPVGVVGAIIPWNAPLMMFALKVAPALACGCAIVLKPSELASLCAVRLAELIEQADLPAGVFNLVLGAEETGKAIATLPGIDKISFTGSRAVGSAILSASGEGMKRVTLELGGKSAAIVFPDADVERVGQGVMSLCSTFLSGQVCSTTSRALVHRSVLNQFVDAAQRQLASVRFGDPFDLRTTSAPMISRLHRQRVLGYIEAGVQEGATLVAGGGVPDGELQTGNWVNPALFVGVDNDMCIAREEIFGPVLAVIPFDDESEAVRIANDSDYGLSGAVYTTNIARALRVTRGLRAGSVGVNGYSVMPNSPAGGFKASGLGREGGWPTIEAFTELKTVMINMSS